MTPQEKAKELYDKMLSSGDDNGNFVYDAVAINCAFIAIENEYNSNRELLFNLRSCGVIENGKTYLHRLQKLIDEEKQLKLELEKL